MMVHLKCLQPSPLQTAHRGIPGEQKLKRDSLEVLLGAAENTCFLFVRRIGYLSDARQSLSYQ